MKNKIVLFGDSVAKGIVFDSENRRYTHGAESFIQLFCSKEGYELTDHALFGCTLTKGAQLVKRHCADMDGSRAVFLMLGGNDCNFDWKAVSKAPDEDHLCCTPPEQFYTEYRALIEFIRKQGSRPIMFNMVPVLGRQYFDWISRNCDGDSIMEFLGCPERIEHWKEMYSLLLQRIAGSCGVPILDLRSVLLQRKDIGDFYCPDGIHPNADGHRLLYGLRKDELKELI